MSLLQNLSDKLSYQLHQLTYDPAAEQYAASQKAAEEAAAAEQKKQNEVANAKQTAQEAEAKQVEAAKQAAEQRAKNEFNLGRFLGKIMGMIVLVLFYFAIFAGAIYGAHLATNLNVYRAWPYRILYAIYGFVFFPLVILYVLGYRYWWQGKKPRFYALLPMIPYFINSPTLAFFFSWLSFKPDAYMEHLYEWNPTMEQRSAERQVYEESHNV